MFKFLSKTPYKVGVALSGGGARGFAHAGALQALEEMGITPGIISGVSAGSVVAAMYAAGIRPHDMLGFFQEAKFSDFCELGVPKDGFFKLDRFKAFLKKHIPYRNLEDLPMPAIIVATEFDHGTTAAFETGPIAEHVTASCSIPIVFKPVKINGVRYVDGGVLHNLPAAEIRERCRFLIGVNCSPLTNRKVKNSILDIAMRSYELMAKTNVIPDMELCDLVIRTDEIASYKVFDLSRIENVYRSGYNDTIRTLLANGFKRPAK